MLHRFLLELLHLERKYQIEMLAAYYFYLGTH